MIRFGIIGTSWITERFIQAGMESGEFVLSAVYSRTEEKGRAFATKYDIPMVYTDLKEMVSSNELDAVYIASPNSSHAEQAIVCMNHGKHVLCEKPMASNVREMQEMIDTARTNDVLLMEAMKSTLMPSFTIMKDNLYKIGRIRRYFASFCRYTSSYEELQKGNIPNVFNLSYSNGSLMDLGVYCIYPMVTLFGKPQSIEATGVLLSTGADGEGSMVMQYGKMDAVIMHSKIADSFLPVEIQGENGTMVIDKISSPQDVKIHYRDGTIEDLNRPDIHKPMYYEIQEFIELLQMGQRESSVNTLANSLAVARVMEEARRQIGIQYPADRLRE
ncbi:Gfo/Idh/MocA family protein [Paenibacillus glacialis]|uniref:Oxidoreductase n=1 Tax=Paenibacillus glacialis TaxID=494026 RepID=A0A168LC14_9BACL|nr:Gfo/Idh/MocA family oxidoreductase [Paenibacillus glacialis]OAB43171.1 oxidoreductase [Paenibacillus glacialis]